MKILVHTDSAFSSLFFTRWLKEQQWEVLGYFYNPNIQPHAEYQRCLMMQKLLAVLEDLIMIYPNNYDFEEYLKSISIFDKQRDRCEHCYYFLLEHCAKYAKKLDIPYYTTSWLLDPHHNHLLLKKVGEEVGEKYGVKFFYQDFSKDWEKADQMAIKLNLYEQPYCGCIYSECYHFYPMTLDEFEKAQTKAELTPETKKEHKKPVSKTRTAKKK